MTIILSHDYCILTWLSYYLVTIVSSRDYHYLVTIVSSRDYHIISWLLYPHVTIILSRDYCILTWLSYYLVTLVSSRDYCIFTDCSIHMNIVSPAPVLSSRDCYILTWSLYHDMNMVYSHDYCTLTWLSYLHVTIPYLYWLLCPVSGMCWNVLTVEWFFGAVSIGMATRTQWTRWSEQSWDMYGLGWVYTPADYRLRSSGYKPSISHQNHP